MQERRRKRRPYPYYKVQLFNDVFQSWMDERGAFGSVEDAKTYIVEKAGDKPARIIVVADRGRDVLQE